MYRGEGGTGKTAESLHTKAERQHSGLLQRTRLWSFLELSELRSCSDLTTEIQKHNNFLRLLCVCSSIATEDNTWKAGDNTQGEAMWKPAAAEAPDVRSGVNMSRAEQNQNSPNSRRNRV